MLQRLWKGEGGFIAGYHWDIHSLGIDPQFQEYAVDEFIINGRRDSLQSVYRHPHSP